MQHFITMTGIEGVVSSAATAIARSLTMPEFDLAGTLSLFIRDEVSSLLHHTRDGLIVPDLDLAQYIHEGSWCEHAIDQASVDQRGVLHTPSKSDGVHWRAQRKGESRNAHFVEWMLIDSPQMRNCTTLRSHSSTKRRRCRCSRECPRTSWRGTSRYHIVMTRCWAGVKKGIVRGYNEMYVL